MKKHSLGFLVVLLFFSTVFYTAGLDYGRPLPESSPSTVNEAWLNSATVFHPDAFAYVGNAYSMLVKHTLNTHYYHNPSVNIYTDLILFWIAGVISLPHNAAFGLREIAPFSLYVMAQYLSALFTLLTVALVYALGIRIFDMSIGLVAASLFAILPLNIQHAHYATPNAQTIAVSTAALLLAIVVLKRPNSHWIVYLLSGSFVGLTMSTRYNAVVVGMVTLLALLVAWTHHRRWWLVLLPLIAIPISFLIGTPGAIFDSANFVREVREILDWYKTQGGGPGWTSPNGLFYHWRYIVLFGIGPVASVATIVGLFATWKNRRTCGRTALIVVSLLLYMLIYSFFALPGKRLNNNLLLPLLVPLTLLAAYGGIWILRNVNRNEKRWINVIGLTFLIGWPLYLSGYMVSLFSSPDNRLQAEAWTYQNVPKGTAISMFGSYNVPLDPLDYRTSNVYGSFLGAADAAWDSQLIIYSDSDAWTIFRDTALTEDPSVVTRTVATEQRLKTWIELANFPRKYWPGQDTPPDDMSVWHQMGVTIYCNPKNCPVSH